MGKTTYCQKLAYDWATSREHWDKSFPMIALLLLLRCHDIKSNLWQAIDEQLLPDDIDEEWKRNLFKFIRENQSSVLFVLDGLDEADYGKIDMFINLAQSKELPECLFVFTSRHESGMEIRCYCDNLWEIVGFTEEDAEDFIFKYFRNMEHLAERLLEEIRSRSDLRQRTSNPLNTALWCILCEDFKEAFPESRTQLYIEIVKYVLRRYEEKKGFSSNNEDLIEVCEEELRSLGRIALQFLLKGELYIEDSKTNANDLNAVKKFGLNGLRASFKKVRRIIKLAFCLIEECGKCNKSLQSQVLHEFGAHLKLEFCTLEMIPRLDFFLEGPSCNTFLTGLDLIPIFRNFQFGGLVISDKGIALLSQALSVITTLTHLNLGNNLTVDSGAASLSQALTVNTLTYLNLGNNDIDDSGAAYLSEALSVNTTLAHLDLDNN